jgi:hypothetical protein
LPLMAKQTSSFSSSGENIDPIYMVKGGGGRYICVSSA